MHKVTNNFLTKKRSTQWCHHSTLILQPPQVLWHAGNRSFPAVDALRLFRLCSSRRLWLLFFFVWCQSEIWKHSLETLVWCKQTFTIVAMIISYQKQHRQLAFNMFWWHLWCWFSKVLHTLSRLSQTSRATATGQNGFPQSQAQVFHHCRHHHHHLHHPHHPHHHQLSVTINQRKSFTFTFWSEVVM